MSKVDGNRSEQQKKMRVQSNAMIGFLTDRGILSDTGIDNEKVREAWTEKQKNTYHNTMMLLQHYRTIVWLFECFPENIAREPEQLSHNELLYRLDMSSRHYYRLRQQAITILSIRLWAAPDTEVDVWLDMLTLIEGLE